MRGRRIPAWLAVFGVVFPTVVGGGILALPVALAPLGPSLAVVVTALLGVVNIVTIGLLAVSVVRRADSLSPFARLGTLARDVLGPGAAVVTTLVVAVLMLGLVVVYALGLSHSLATTIGLSAPTWAVAALVCSALLVGFQLRRVLMTAGTTVTAASLTLLVALIVLLGSHLDRDLLLSGPPAPLTASSFTLVFGALMGAYFGHTSVPTIAPATFRADPSGRSLIVGSVAAMTAATIVNTAWVLVTLGSTPAADYQSAGSTGINLVRAVAGPLAGWLALAFVLLALGVAGMISAFVLGDLAVEQLPIPRALTLDLTGGVVLRAHDGSSEPVRISVTTTPDGHGLLAHAQRGRRFATVPVTAPQWDASALVAAVDGRRWGRWLRLEVAGTTVQARSTMVLGVDTRQASAAVRVLDDGLSGRITALLLRQPRTLEALADAIDLPVADVEQTLHGLEDEGVVDRAEDATWHVHLGHRRTVDTAHGVLPTAVSDPLDMAPRSPAWIATNAAARIVATVPLVIALVIVLVLQASGATFTRVFSLIGISAFVLVGTTIPLLIAIASRRSADRVVRAGALALPAASLWAIWWATLVVCGAYAVVIYAHVGERLAAALTVVLSLACAWLARRAGAFRGSSALVVSVAPDGAITARLTDAGADRRVDSPLSVPAPGRTLDVVIEPAPCTPLRVVVHQDDVPRPLVELRARSANAALTFTASHLPGSGTVDITDAAAPVNVSWLVG